MKILGLILALSATPAALGAPYQLVTTCKARLTGPDGEQQLSVASAPYVATADGFDNSPVSIAVGDYSVFARMVFGASDSDSAQEPRFVVSLFQGGNPITGQINYSDNGGLDLDHRRAGVPLSVASAAFIATSFEGHMVTRIDYSCAVTKQ